MWKSWWGRADVERSFPKGVSVEITARGYKSNRNALLDLKMCFVLAVPSVFSSKILANSIAIDEWIHSLALNSPALQLNTQSYMFYMSCASWLCNNLSAFSHMAEIICESGQGSMKGFDNILEHFWMLEYPSLRVNINIKHATHFSPGEHVPVQLPAVAPGPGPRPQVWVSEY